MTQLERLAADTTALSCYAARLETLQLRHEALRAAFDQTEQDAICTHSMDESAACSIARMRRIDRLIASINAQTDRIFSAIQNASGWKGDA